MLFEGKYLGTTSLACRYRFFEVIVIVVELVETGQRSYTGEQPTTSLAFLAGLARTLAERRGDSV